MTTNVNEIGKNGTGAFIEYSAGKMAYRKSMEQLLRLIEAGAIIKIGKLTIKQLDNAKGETEVVDESGNAVKGEQIAAALKLLGAKQPIDILNGIKNISNANAAGKTIVISVIGQKVDVKINAQEIVTPPPAPAETPKQPETPAISNEKIIMDMLDTKGIKELNPDERKIFDEKFKALMKDINDGKTVTYKEIDERTRIPRKGLWGMDWAAADFICMKLEDRIKNGKINIFEMKKDHQAKADAVAQTRAFVTQIKANATDAELAYADNKEINREEARLLGISDQLFDLIDNMMVVGKGDGKITLDDINKFNEVIKKYAKITFCEDNEPDSINKAIDDYKNAKGFEMKDLDAYLTASQTVPGLLGITDGSTGDEVRACLNNKLIDPFKRIMIAFCDRHGISGATKITADLFKMLSLRLISMGPISQRDDAFQEARLGVKGLPKYEGEITAGNYSNYLQGKKLEEKKAEDKAAGSADSMNKALAAVRQNDPAINKEGEYDKWVDACTKALEMLRSRKSTDLSLDGLPTSWENVYKSIVESLIMRKEQFMPRLAPEKTNPLINELMAALQDNTLYQKDTTVPEKAMNQANAVLLIAALKKKKGENPSDIQTFVNDNIKPAVWNMPLWGATPDLKAKKIQFAIDVAAGKAQLFISKTGDKYVIAAGCNIDNELAIMADGWEVPEPGTTGFVIGNTITNKLPRDLSSLTEEQAAQVYMFRRLLKEKDAVISRTLSNDKTKKETKTEAHKARKEKLDKYYDKFFSAPEKSTAKGKKPGEVAPPPPPPKQALTEEKIKTKLKLTDGKIMSGNNPYNINVIDKKDGLFSVCVVADKGNVPLFRITNGKAGAIITTDPNYKTLAATLLSNFKS